MATTTTTTNKPLNPRAQDLSPKGYNRANIFSGKALSFDGVNDILTTGAVSATLNSFTITGYMKFDAFNVNDAIPLAFAATGSSAERFILFQNATDGDKLYIYSPTLDVASAYSSNYTLQLGQWFHYAITFGTSMTFYINGRQTASYSLTSSTALSNDFIFGARKLSSYQQYFNGDHAGFKAFGVTLTPAQVSDLYLNPEKIVPDGVASSALKLWLPMMEGAGASAYDGSGNGNDGTINGATWTAGIGAPVAQTALVSWNKGVNLVPYSEQLDQWSTAGATNTANQTTAPNGTLTADKSVVSASNQYHDSLTRSITTTIGVQYETSIFAKKGTGIESLYFYQGDGARIAKWNLTTGAYIGHAPTDGYIAFTSYGSEDAGNGWFRFWARYTASGTSANYTLGIMTTTDNRVLPYLGNGTDFLYIWGTTYRPTSAGDAYIKTNATAQTSAVLVPEGLTAGASIFGTDIITPRNAFALNLDGASWAQVGDNASLDISPAMTMEVWAKFDGITTLSHQTFINKAASASWNSPFSRYCVRACNTNIQWWFEDANQLEQYDVTLTGWHHLVITKSGTAEILYLDGAQVDTNTGAATITASSFPLYIGQNTNGAELLNDQLANPRIYNRALTAAEVLRNYNADKAKFGL